MDYKPGMYVYALAFLLGVLFLQQFAVLPRIDTLSYLLMFLTAGVVVFTITARQKRSALRAESTLIINFILLIYYQYFI